MFAKNRALLFSRFYSINFKGMCLPLKFSPLHHLKLSINSLISPLFRHTSAYSAYWLRALTRIVGWIFNFIISIAIEIVGQEPYALHIREHGGGTWKVVDFYRCKE